MPLIVNRLDKSRYGDYIQFPSDEIIIVYSGVFSFKYVYYLMHEWFVENRYTQPAEQHFREEQYAQRDSAAGKEIFVKWRLRKETDDYYYNAYELDLVMHTLALSETEVLIEGKKMKLDKGEVEFKFYPRIMINPKASKAWYMKGLTKKWFESKYLIEKKLEHYRYFKQDIERMQEAIKEYFEIERYLEGRDLLEFYKSRMGQ